MLVWGGGRPGYPHSLPWGAAGGPERADPRLPPDLTARAGRGGRLRVKARNKGEERAARRGAGAPSEPPPAGLCPQQVKRRTSSARKIPKKSTRRGLCGVSWNCIRAARAGLPACLTSPGEASIWGILGEREGGGRGAPPPTGRKPKVKKNKKDKREKEKAGRKSWAFFLFSFSNHNFSPTFLLLSEGVGR